MSSHTAPRPGLLSLLFLLLIGLAMAPVLLALEATNPSDPSARFSGLTIAEPGAVVPQSTIEPGELAEDGVKRAGWEQFVAGQQGRWVVKLDARSELPALVTGAGIPWIHGAASSLPAGSPATQLQLEELAREFIDSHPRLLGRWPGQLELDREASGATGAVWRIVFRQVVDSVPVAGARYAFHVSHGNLVAFGASRWAEVRRPAEPNLSREQALAALAHYVGAEEFEQLVPREQGTLRLVPVAAGANEYDHLLVYRFVFDVPGEAPTWVAEVDADSGEVVALFDNTRYEQIKGGVFPNSNTGECELDACEVAGYPLGFADYSEDGGADQYASESGRYECSTSFARMSTNLVGQYVRVNDNCGAVSAWTYCDENLDLGTSPGADCNVAAGASPGNTRAARTSYYHLDRAKLAARAYLPDNTWLTQLLTDNININNTCNAFWNGTVNFYRSGGGCGNTGELSAVMVHEWGHGLDQNDGGGMDNSSEAYADVAAIFYTRDSCIGPGFRPGINCSGFGDACLDCTGVREMDWDQRASHTPATPANFNDVYCDSGPGPCGKQVHCESHVPTESVWDLANRDLPAMGLDAESSWQVAERLWYLSRDGSGGDIYNCNLPNGDSCGTTSWFHRMRLADDDDGNLANGTPHAAAIFAAFDRHAIACGSASDPEHQNSGSCPAMTAPVLAGSAVNGGAELEWTAVTNAAEYIVYRNEMGCHRGQWIVETVPELSASHDQLANDLTLYYRVQPVGSNGACLGAVSNCLPLTPRRFAGKVRFGQPAYGCSHAITISVSDANAGSSSVSVELSSDSELIPETLSLDETEPGSGHYAGQIFSTTAPAAADGLLTTTHGDDLVVEYTDADDGEGQQNLVRSHFASADCLAPAISGISEENVTTSAATITWQTDESADSVVIWGPLVPPDQSESDSELVVDHSLRLTGLEECTVYYYELQSGDLAGNVAVADNNAQYFHFETLGDFGSGPQPCHQGQVSIGDEVYSCASTMTFSVVDLDLNLDPEQLDTHFVQVTSSTEIEPEVVVITETDINSSEFTGSIALAAGEPMADGTLQVVGGDVATVSYHDADDGTGAALVSFDTATLDCAGPGISGLRVEAITHARAAIRWTTSEPADTVVEWGTTPALGESSSSAALTTSHERILNQFDVCAQVFFRVRSTDTHGNSLSFDNGGEPFSFLTYEIPGLYWRDSFEDAAGAWSLGGEWEIAAPQGLGGSSGRADPATAYNNSGLLGHDLSGLGDHAGDYEPDSDESAASPDLDASAWTNTKLLLQRRLNAGQNDEASIWLFTGPGVPLYRSEGEAVAESSFSLMEADISARADGQPAVRIEFRQQADGAGQYSGWNIDDVIFKDGSLPNFGACGGCSQAASFAGISDLRDNDACAASGITVEWEQAVAWGSGASGSYAVYRDTTPGFEPGPANRIASGVVGTSYNDLDAPAGGPSVFYRVLAETDESCGEGPHNGGLLDGNDVIGIATDFSSQPEPGAVAGLSAQLVGGVHLRLEWPAAAGAATYRVYRSDRPQPDGFVQLSEGSELVYEDLGAGASAANWFYLVRSVNACGEEGP